MKTFHRIWLFGLALAGLILILTRDSLAGAIGMPGEIGPWVVVGACVALIALAIAPRFLFRR
jgi:hypothetical protein